MSMGYDTKSPMYGARIRKEVVSCPMSINYELAVKLKDAGFPQIQGDYGFFIGQIGNTRMRQAIGTNYTNGLNTKNVVYIPDLSELIEACGDDFELLAMENYPKGNKFWKAYPTDEWFYKNENDCVKDCCGYETGDSREEAVANLWISLHK
jgi:hypothetical protein